MSPEILSKSRPWRRGALAVIMAAVLLLPAHARGAGGYDRTGEASWYGGRYQGRSTANGEAFDMNALTAAHRQLAFGTRVRVTNLANRRSVVVRINDRGPYARGRIIDLSRRAAALLGFRAAGVARVRVETVQEAPSAAAAPAPRRVTLSEGRVTPSEESIRESLRITRAAPTGTIRLRPPPGVHR